MKKKLLIAPIIGAFLLTGCKISLFGKTIYLFEKKPTQDNSQDNIDDVTPTDGGKEATSISQDPTAPFYLKVGESREVKVTLSPAPSKDEQKQFTWSKTGNAANYVVNETETNKATVTGVSPGKVELTATNTYDVTLKRTFYIDVIEFDEEKDYLWQYTSSDRAQFGYVYQTKNQGDAEGTATLNGVPWSYLRESVDIETQTVVPKAVSLNVSQSGYLGFGKGKEPEVHLHFETENERVVNKFAIEASSAHALAKMTVKVGETVYLDNVTVSEWDKQAGNLIASSNNITPASGKIEIDVVTPRFDAARADDPTYLAPGGFFIKCILINFNEKLPDKTMTLVKSTDDIVDGAKYLIVGQFPDESFGCLDGTRKSGTKDNPYIIENFEIKDSVNVKNNFDQYSFTASIDENSKLNFTSGTNIKLGLNGSGDLSTTETPAKLGWSYTVASNIVDMTMETDDEKVKHFGANTSGTTKKFAAYAKATNNIYLFKF